MGVNKEEYIHRIGIRPSDTIEALMIRIKRLEDEIKALKDEIENNKK